MLAATATPIVLLMLAAVAILLWLGAQRRCAFRIHIDDGKVQRVHGDAPRQFLEEVGRLCEFWDIERGQVEGVRRGRRIAIRVRGMDPRHAQTFRNAWHHPL